MSDYQQIVDRVRAFVAGADQTRTDALAELASGYAATCEEANNRLRRCVDYLHRGLRSEAVHLADGHPNLLEMVAALDIPEIDQWEQLCAAYELARPARMMIDMAQELNEAYADQQPLQGLLARHRLLALSRAPLRERLEVIRELAGADPTNQCWADDQEVFERVRVRELRGDVTAAIKSRNVSDVDLLSAEILRQPWRIELPADIKDSLTRASWGLHAEEATVMLQAMIPQMHAAIDSSSYSVAKQLAQKWEQITKQYQLNPHRQLNDEFKTLRTWIGEQDREHDAKEAFAEACSELRLGLDTRQPEEVLIQSFRAAQDAGRKLPADLERDYRDALAKFERGRKAERFGVYATIAVVAIIMTILVVGMVWNSVASKAK